jgi:hypothetical protein
MDPAVAPLDKVPFSPIPTSTSTSHHQHGGDQLPELEGQDRMRCDGPNALGQGLVI